MHRDGVRHEVDRVEADTELADKVHVGAFREGLDERRGARLRHRTWGIQAHANTHSDSQMKSCPSKHRKEKC
eukprot:6172538-Pleurochrysis_carterae.AAC.3